jgi:hypothetical protein
MGKWNGEDHGRLTGVLVKVKNRKEGGYPFATATKILTKRAFGHFCVPQTRAPGI